MDALKIQEVKDYFINNYFPAKNIQETNLHLTSEELSEKLSKINGEYIDEKTLNDWLREGNYIFLDFGDMRFEWIFKTLQ
ncbi:hypothetical protein [Paracoccus sp. (in: a-proteobacteria)]|uniref:hypothetical protein n=1 Tax=Paracoccus sp. TaxID=267 RepID=UPI00321FB97D